MTFQQYQKPTRLWRWLAVLSAWLALAGNVPLWQELWRLGSIQSVRGVFFAAGFAMIIWLALMAFFYLAAWPRVLRLFATFWVLVAAFSAHYMMAYHVVIDTSMLVNVMETDVREVRDLLSVPMALTVLLMAVPALWWIWRKPVRFQSWFKQLRINLFGSVLSVLVMLAIVWLIFQDFSSSMRNHKHLRFMINPLNSAFAVLDMGVIQGHSKPTGWTSIGQDAQPLGARPGGKPLLFVLVIGETARAANFSINGYGRQTSTHLENLQAQGELSNFSNVKSCGTSTAESLPCMFSHLGRLEYFKRKSNYENVLDVLHRAGLAVFWLDNQSGCKGLCDRIPNANVSSLKVKGLCETGECLDEVMLDHLDERLAALDPARVANGIVLVMHQMGSHGPAYFKRSPTHLKPFQPECSSNQLQDCPRERVINAYDNTIVYTDHFLGQVVGWLKQQSANKATAMLYLSDHGESLGENNLYLHGLPYTLAPEVQKQVPMVLWLSTRYQQQYGIQIACVSNSAKLPYSHDNLFHTTLGLSGVRSQEYLARLDVTAACRAKR
jgi:lipid A ethanolaminephosphotransferase